MVRTIAVICMFFCVSCAPGFIVESTKIGQDTKRKSLHGSVQILEVTSECPSVFSGPILDLLEGKFEVGSRFIFVPVDSSVSAKQVELTFREFSGSKLTRKLRKLQINRRYYIDFSLPSGATVHGYWVDYDCMKATDQSPYPNALPSGCYAIRDDFGSGGIILVDGDEVKMRNY